jgi:amino acid adenylation domain-containing protein/thioester reductase-like protein
MTGNGTEHVAGTPQSPWSRQGDCYVVVNDAGQHALWPAALNLPAGWWRRSRAMSRQACLAEISGEWTDIAPASLSRPDPAGYPAQFIHDLVSKQAATRPRSIAVTAETGKVTYLQLERSANQMAQELRGLGVGPEVIVGVSLERGIDAVRCMLAIWKAGGAYLPLDPGLPAARLTEMCAQARPAIILGSDGGETLPRTGARLLPAARLSVPGQAARPPTVGVHPDSVAYVIYTSGSTGHPKGVAVSYASLTRQIRDVARAYEITPRDRVVQLASLAFDTSIEQVLVTLLSGATLLLPPPGTVAPTDLLRYLAEQRVTVVDLTPAYWHQLLAIAGPDDARLRRLRLMITGGELANPGDCQAALRAATRARLVNAYGLTETTITSTLADIRPAMPERGVPAGKPLPHAQVLVLDEHLAPAAAGEIYIGGEGLARGYLGDPGRTAERFVPNPRGAVPGGRMYRTGDLGRWLEDGDLEVIGRVDRQLKARGFRVEPAEIEHALLEHPAIRRAAVVAREISQENTQLTAYYERRFADDHGQLSGESLRAFLADRVPGFMIPAEFIALHQIPRTPDGEVDEQALRLSPDSWPAARSADGGAPYTSVQIGLSHLWSRILQQDRVGLDDDFFAAGGNSLLAAEMLSHVRVMFGISARSVRALTRCLLRDATLRGFSDAVQAARVGELETSSHDARADFAADAAFNFPIGATAGLGSAPRWQRPRRVLLTGATGFLGVHLLKELLTTTTADVHCLVRARDGSHALRRISRAAGRYGVGGLDLSRVLPVTGDLAEPGLGLPAAGFRKLARAVDTIYHAGALVNFIYPYTELRAANVTGTRELIGLASLYRAIPIHYVSTTAVLAGFGEMGVREVTEDTPLAYADRLCIGYVESKFVAEELLRNASRAGLPVAIYRPLDIVGDLRTGTWNTATEMCALIRFMADTGLAPDIDLPLDFVPADVCAAAIRYISTHAGADGQTYHLSSPRYALLGSLVERLRRHGYKVDAIAYSDWVGELVKYAAKHPSHPMTPFVPLFVDHCHDSVHTVAEMYLEHVFPSYSRTRLERALSGSGIAFPPVDDGLFDLAIGRLMETGYLPAPSGEV